MGVAVVTRDERSASFFDAAAESHLIIRRCIDCGHYGAPSNEVCRSCGSTNLSWIAASGVGNVVGRTVIPSRRRDDPEPAILGIIELSEGPWIFASVVGSAPELVQIGCKVEVGFERPPGGEPVPVFSLST
jgi:uncharacterized OB-fold protein